MKRKLVKLLFVVLLLSVWGAKLTLAESGGTSAASFPRYAMSGKAYSMGPFLSRSVIPADPCAAKLFDGGPVPICFPGHPCILR